MTTPKQRLPRKIKKKLYGKKLSQRDWANFCKPITGKEFSSIGINFTITSPSGKIFNGKI